MILQGTREQLDAKAAWILEETIQSILETKSKVIVAVPGGRSVTGIFQELAEVDIDWHRVHLFMVDERLVPIDHQENNFRLVVEALGKIVPEASLHPFVYDVAADDYGVEEYEHQLMQFGGRFDIVLVSSGEDGHIAALFPKHQAMVTYRRRFVSLEDSPKPPLRRMTATPELIGSSQVGLLLFYGESKMPALKNFLNPQLDVGECPAKLITTLPQHFILTDLKLPLQ